MSFTLCYPFGRRNLSNSPSSSFMRGPPLCAPPQYHRAVKYIIAACASCPEGFYSIGESKGFSYRKKISAEDKALMICFISYTYIVLKARIISNQCTERHFRLTRNRIWLGTILLLQYRIQFFIRHRNFYFVFYAFHPKIIFSAETRL